MPRSREFRAMCKRGGRRWLGLFLSVLAVGGCGGGGGGSSDNDGSTGIPPTLQFSATPSNIITGQSTMLTWTSTNASSCSASGSWSGSKATSGSKVTAALTAAATYILNCKGPGGSTEQWVTVDVFPPPPSPLGIKAAFGDRSITVSWLSNVGTAYAGFDVTTNIYVSTRPNIEVRNFPVSADNQVKRGLNTMLPVVFDGLTNGTPVYIVATDEANGIQSEPTPEISVTPRVPLAIVEHIENLNDTGVVGCSDLATRNLPCPVPSLPNQDAEVGRDARAHGGQLTKVGFGPAGFDFTKIDAGGNPTANDAVTWSCVRDNVTGLIWEVPGGSALTSAENSYTWYQPDPLLNAGETGERNGGVCVGSECDTFGFIAALNEARYCGYSDWRLPTGRELFSLVDMSLNEGSFAASVFPDRPPIAYGYIWTSTHLSASTQLGSAVWALKVQTGQMDYKSKWVRGPGDHPGYILAVRADAVP